MSAMDKRGLLADEAGYGTHEQAPIHHHEEPKKGCRDPFFLVLFVVNIGVIIWLASTYGATAIRRETPPTDTHDNTELPKDAHPIIILCTILAAAAGVMSGGWMTFMIRYASDIIKFMLWTSIIMSLVSAVLGLVSGQIALVVFGLVFAAINFCYMRSVERFIPFAAAQLRAATAAIKDFFSVVYFAYGLLLIAFTWCVVWSLAIYGVIHYFDDQKVDDGSSSSSSDTSDDDEDNIAGVYYFLLLVSFFWTLQVVGGVVNCTVAGVVGSWWFIPSSDHQSVVSGSFGRASTTSLGSICFGSLVVAVLEALKATVETAREQRDSVAKCLVDCLVSCLDNMAQYFNRWAFTYIGIYGHSFVEAGGKVYRLFVRRGLTSLINDNLIGRVLFLGAVMVGLVTCGIGVILAWILQDTWLSDYPNAPGLLAGAGFIVGLFVCDVMMNVVSAAVAAVLVCFIEDPAALQITHPDYHEYLKAAWRMRYPDMNW